MVNKPLRLSAPAVARKQRFAPFGRWANVGHFGQHIAHFPRRSRDHGLYLRTCRLVSSRSPAVPEGAMVPRAKPSLGPVDPSAWPGSWGWRRRLSLFAVDVRAECGAVRTFSAPIIVWLDSWLIGFHVDQVVFSATVVFNINSEACIAFRARSGAGAEPSAR